MAKPHYLLTDRSVLKCAHQGVIAMSASQTLVSINGAPVLVEPDPVGKGIAGCPMAPPASIPCTVTLKLINDQGYSSLLRINGKRICLDTVSGFTNGAPPGTVKYSIMSVGQDLVGESA